MLRRTFVGAALVLCLLPLAAPTPLLDPDEGLHAAIAQEMVLRHDFVTPTFLGEPFLDKPILFFWAEAFSLRAFGMHETAVRLPPVVFGLLGMLGVAALGRALFDEATGLVGGVVYGTMLLPAALGNVAVHDVGLTPFLCVAALGLWRAAASPRAWAWGLLIGLCFGLSILTKGLVGVAFAGMFAVCLAVLRPAAIPRLVVALVVAAIVGAAVAAPWYLAMEHAHPGYLRYYFVERHLRGYLTATQRHAGRAWWYYLPVLAGGTLPWMPYAVASAFRRTNALLLAWFLLGLVFLSIGESKLVTYVLPTIPALALLAAAYLRAVDPRVAAFRAAFAVHAIVMTALPPLALAAIAWKFGPVPGAMWAGAALAAVAALVAAFTAWRRTDVDARFARLTLLTLVGLAFVIGYAAPYGGRWMTAKDLAASLNASAALPPRVSILDERIGSVVFYLSPALRAQATSDRIGETSLADAVEHLRIDPPDAILAVRDDHVERLTRLFRRQAPPDGRAGTFLIYRAETLRRALGLSAPGL